MAELLATARIGSQLNSGNGAVLKIAPRGPIYVTANNESQDTPRAPTKNRSFETNL